MYCTVLYLLYFKWVNPLTRPFSSNYLGNGNQSRLNKIWIILPKEKLRWLLCAINFYRILNYFKKVFTLGVLFFKKHVFFKKLATKMCRRLAKRINFPSCNLQDSSIQSCNLQDSNFLSCNLQDRIFLTCNMQDRSLLSCKLQDSSFLLCNLQDRIFLTCNL